MELVLSDDHKIVLRFDEDDELVSELILFAGESNVDAACISGLGSAKEVELGFYDWSKKEYIKKTFNEPMEVVSITGNVGTLDTNSAVHLHGAFGLPDYQLIGGHVHKLIVNTTAEIVLDTIGGELRRGYDETTGLNLLTS